MVLAGQPRDDQNPWLASRAAAAKNVICALDSRPRPKQRDPRNDKNQSRQLLLEDYRVGQILDTPRRAPSPRAMWRSIQRLYGPGSPCSRRISSRAPSAIRARRSMTCSLFHVVFGKTVPDISLNAIANLGYAGRPLPASRPFPAIRSRTGLRGHRPQGELEQGDRHRSTCARRAGTRKGEVVLGVRALGDGAQARQADAPAPGSVVPSCPTVSIPPRSA